MLTDIAVRKLAPKEKRYSVLDSEGLYIEVLPSGGKHWRIRKIVDGKEYRRSLGHYPDVGVKDARRKRDAMAEALMSGQPSSAADSVTFAAVAAEWLRQVETTRTHGHTRTVASRLDRLILPYVGNLPVREVAAKDLLAMAKAQQQAGKIETAHRIRQICGQIMRFAVANGLADRDPSSDIRGAIMSKNPTHYPTITDPTQIGGLMRAIHAFSGTPIVRCAMLLQAYTATRPGETRWAEWDEFDGDLWRIPAARMKRRLLHVVPLSTQAQAVLDDLRHFSGAGTLLFPSARDRRRPISDAAVNAGLRRMGYAQDEFTAHSFRSMFSTVANENGWAPDAIERQLAHVEGNAVRAAYNHAEYLPQRRELMQWWADWLEQRASDCSPRK